MRTTAQMSVCMSLCAAMILTVTTLALVTPASAADPLSESVGRSASTIALDERIAAGDLKYRDSRTGEVVVATHARIAMLRLELAPHFGWPVEADVATAADGTVRGESNGAMRDVHVARTNLDGTRARGCFRDLDAAIAFVVGLDEYQKEHADDQADTAVAE